MNEQEALRTRWRLMAMNGRVSDVLTEVNALLAQDESSDRAFLLNFQASVYIQLGSYEAALESASQALNVSDGSTDPQTLAFVHSNIATASAESGRNDAADASFEIAEQMLEELGDEWALGTVLMNHGVCEIRRGNSERGLALLARAASCRPASEAQKKEMPIRLAQIRLSRSLELNRRRKTRDAIIELLSARREAAQANEQLLVAKVDFNLALMYNQLELYSSALQAAESAAQIYEAAGAGSTRLAREAWAVAAMVLASLGKKDQARSLVDALLSGASDKEIEEIRGALLEIVKVFRQQDFGDPYDLDQFGHQVPSSEVDVITERLSQLRHQNYAGAAYAESEELISQLEAMGGGSYQLAQIQRVARDAYINPENPMALSPETIEFFEESFGPRVRQVDLALRGSAASQAGLYSEVLNAHLAILWDVLDSWYEQQEEASRSEFISGGKQRDLISALDFAADLDRPDVIMEVIETLRIDVSQTGLPEMRFGLAPFEQLTNEASHIRWPSLTRPQEIPRIRYLGDPRPVAVRGRSAMAEAASLAQQPVDLDQLRIKLAGQDAMWWSCSILDQTMFWALITPDNNIAGGKRDLTGSLSVGIEAHLRMLPMVLKSDLALLDNLLNPSTARMIALARSASTMMLNSAAIVDAVLASLPAARRSLVRDYCAEAGQIDLFTTYEILADELLPDKIRQELLAANHSGKLIVTLPPELATLPIGLLPVDARSTVLDHASIQFSPPTGLASRLTTRPSGEPPRPHVLAISDTAGDLPWATSYPSSPVSTLTGWSRARDINEVATIHQVERRLRSGNWHGGGLGVFSYTGHLVAGNRDHPGSAAFVCAHTNMEGLPDLLTASDVLSWPEDCFPSHVYLGGCEGTGFGTGLEWASLAAAALARGASCVLSHAWPIVDSPHMADIDRTCIEILTRDTHVGRALGNAQRAFLNKWRRSELDAIPPHFWAGLQLIGRTCPS